jgi:heme/copper-type cytochrome/quinol oxidase subunit 4
MKNLRESTKIYLILIILTFLAFFIGLTEVSSAWFVVVLLLSTFIKGKMIIDYFMGMNEYASRWNNFPTLWLGLVVLVTVGIYFL